MRARASARACICMRMFARACVLIFYIIFISFKTSYSAFFSILFSHFCQDEQNHEKNFGSLKRIKIIKIKKDQKNSSFNIENFDLIEHDHHRCARLQTLASGRSFFQFLISFPI